MTSTLDQILALCRLDIAPHISPHLYNPMPRYPLFQHPGMAASFSSEPLERLNGEFVIYEDLLQNAMTCPLTLGEEQDSVTSEQHLSGVRWRHEVQSVSAPDFSSLKEDKRMLQRAHHVLAFLIHFYVHSTPGTDAVIVPKSISLPLVVVSDWLGIAPILTYSDVVWWNWTYADNSNAAFDASNMVFRTLFNSMHEAREDEEEFYRSCAAIEIRRNSNASTIFEILRLTDIILNGDTQDSIRCELVDHLRNLADTVRDFTSTILCLKHVCRPDAFYGSIRPWFRGFHPAFGRTWVFECIENMEELPLLGPSAGQTPAINAVDALMGIEHGPDSRAFMDEVLEYMPKEQRAMIRQFRSQAPRLHQLMERCADVRLACIEVLKVLTDFRSEHLKVAVRYVVNPKNRGSLTCPVTGKMAASPHNISTKSHGTGGTEMSKLLKAIRDATKQLAASAQVA